MARIPCRRESWTSLSVDEAESERSPLVDLIGDYWSPVDLTRRRADLLSPGQMFWAPIIYRDDDLTLLRLASYDPQDERRSRFELTAQSAAMDAFNHVPVKELELRTDEEMVVFRAKHRSALLYSSPMLQPEGQPERGRSFLVIPHYSFHEKDPADFRESVRLFEYSAVFHAPAEPTLRIPDGFFRFDRTSVVPREAISNAMAYRLTPDALTFLDSWFEAFRTGVLRDDLLRELIEEARKAKSEEK